MTMQMRGPTFKDIRRRFGIRLALAWLAMVWRWGLIAHRVTPGRRAHRLRPPTRRRRAVSRTMRVAEYAILAIVISVWSFWAYLILKGAIAYTHSAE